MDIQELTAQVERVSEGYASRSLPATTRSMSSRRSRVSGWFSPTTPAVAGDRTTQQAGLTGRKRSVNLTANFDDMPKYVSSGRRLARVSRSARAGLRSFSPSQGVPRSTKLH